MATTIDAASEPPTDAKVWLAVIGSIIGAFIAVLNIQITNASLPDIQGAIGAGIDVCLNDGVQRFAHRVAAELRRHRLLRPAAARDRKPHSDLNSDRSDPLLRPRHPRLRISHSLILYALSRFGGEG